MRLFVQFVHVRHWCQVYTDASSFSSFQCQSFFSFVFFFSPSSSSFCLSTLVCIIIICPERAPSERGLFVLQPGTRLFSGSPVFVPTPSVPFNTPGKFAFVSDIFLFFFLFPFLSCWPLSISPHQFTTLPRCCQSFWLLIVSMVFFAQCCRKDI